MAVYQKPIYNVEVGDEIAFPQGEDETKYDFKKVTAEPETLYSPIDKKIYGDQWCDGDIVFQLEDGTYTGGGYSTIITAKDTSAED